MGKTRTVMSAVFALGMLLPAVPAFSQDVSFHVETDAGVMMGVASEIVLDNGYTVSQLDWSLKPVFFVGTSIILETRIGFTASLSVRSGIPGQSGSITDSDYLNMDGVVTHYSRHDCFTEQALLMDARLGWSFTLFEAFTLDPFLGFSTMHFKWTARDGYIQYPPESNSPFTPWSASMPQISVYGTGIIYQQDYLIPTVGLSAGYGFFENVSARLSFTFSPYVLCNDLDNHELRQLDFYENMAGGMLFEPELEVELRINARARVSLNVSYRLITGLIGDSYIVYTGVDWPGTYPAPGSRSSPYPNGGGAGFGAFSAGLSFTLSL